MRSKKTLRRMTPARRLASLGRAMQRIEKRLAALTEALEQSERAAVAQIIGHGLVCPLAHEPSKPLWPDLPNGEAVAHETVGERMERAILDRIAPTGSDVEQGGEGAGYHEGSAADPRD